MFFSLPWRLLFDGALAGRLADAAAGRALPAPEAPPPEPTPAPVAEVAPEVVGPDYTAGLQVLAILQREGRFIDFLQENVAEFSDAEIGAAARVVHAGCKKALAEYVTLAPVRPEADGARITLAPGFDALRHRLTGNVVGEPPYTGELAHPGWQVTRIELPTLSPGHDARVVAPAEVELT
ncbi:MAG: DUF2760 domain-containing protein [Myxococcales bacterium]|nr:DUF2760 domain-containing protein [Myxococcales bacterium]